MDGGISASGVKDGGLDARMFSCGLWKGVCGEGSGGSFPVLAVSIPDKGKSFFRDNSTPMTVAIISSIAALAATAISAVNDPLFFDDVWAAAGVEVLLVSVASGVAEPVAAVEGVAPGVPFAVGVWVGWGEPNVPPTTITVGSGVGVMPG